MVEIDTLPVIGYTFKIDFLLHDLNKKAFQSCINVIEGHENVQKVSKAGGKLLFLFIVFM